MRLRIFTLRFSSSIENFDDGPVQSFILDRNVIEVRDHFFEYRGEVYWAVMVIYSDAEANCGEANPKGARDSLPKEDYRMHLTDATMPAFNALKEWRNDRAKRDAVPPYVILNNRQLAQIASKNPTSLNDLSNIEGVGPSKLQKYGDDILTVIHNRIPSKEQHIS